MDFLGLSIVSNKCLGFEESSALSNFSAELVAAGLFRRDLNEEDCGAEACQCSHELLMQLVVHIELDRRWWAFGQSPEECALLGLTVEWVNVH